MLILHAWITEKEMEWILLDSVSRLQSKTWDMHLRSPASEKYLNDPSKNLITEAIATVVQCSSSVQVCSSCEFCNPVGHQTCAAHHCQWHFTQEWTSGGGSVSICSSTWLRSAFFCVLVCNKMSCWDVTLWEQSPGGGTRLGGCYEDVRWQCFRNWGVL